MWARVEGFRASPLPCCFRKCTFTLCDSIGKKVKVVNAVADALGLTNVEGAWARAEDLTDRPPFDFVTSRAVAKMPGFSGLGAATDC